MEPNEYFKSLKEEVQMMDSPELEQMLRTVEGEITRAHAIGQDSIVERLVFSRSAIVREIQASLAGVNRYVYKKSIAKFIDSVRPKNSVKFIELSRYPRIIPAENLADILRVKEMGIFDNFGVLFTDLTNEQIETEEEIRFKQRNRDPIVFGYHEKSFTHLRSDRFYLITDWEDEYCDLTFDKMIATMSKRDHGNVDITDPVELQRIIDDVTDKSPKSPYGEPEPDREIEPPELYIEPGIVAHNFIQRGYFRIRNKLSG